MLIKDDIVEKIRAGEITLVFRRWSWPGAKAGGAQMTQGGVIAIESVDIVADADISDADAMQAGYANATDLIEHLNYRDDPIYRIRVRFAGEDPRIALRENAELTAEEFSELVAKLDKLDRNSRRGTWTREFLQLIHHNPATYSGVLARKVDMEIPKFKPLVRKLKTLGLTESLEIGYRLSPRGEKVLQATENTIKLDICERFPIHISKNNKEIDSIR